MKPIKNYKKKFIVLGGGRWGLVHANELSKNFKDSIIFIYTNKNYKKLSNTKLKNNITVISKLSEVLKLDINLVILANRYYQNYLLLQKFSHLKFNTIVEKPFLAGENNFQNIYNNYKNNNVKLSISTPWLYDQNLLSISKKIKLKDIESIKFIWFNKKNLVRYNQKRKFDPTITHLIDIISHIVSIIMCLLNKKKIDIENIKYQKLLKLEKTSFNLFNIKILIENSNNHSLEKREVLISTNSKNIYKIKLNSNFVKFSKNNKLLKKYNDQKNKINTQHQNILKNSKVQQKKDFDVFNSISVITKKILIEINK